MRTPLSSYVFSWLVESCSGRNLFISSTTGNETLCFLFFRSRVITSKTKRSNEKWRTGGSFWRMSCRVASSSDWHLEHRYLMKGSAKSMQGVAEHITYYPQIMSQVEEVLRCSFRVRHYPIMRGRPII